MKFLKDCTEDAAARLLECLEFEEETILGHMGLRQLRGRAGRNQFPYLDAGELEGGHGVEPTEASQVLLVKGVRTLGIRSEKCNTGQGHFGVRVRVRVRVRSGSS